jgi:signal peptidase II
VDAPVRAIGEVQAGTTHITGQTAGVVEAVGSASSLTSATSLERPRATSPRRSVRIALVVAAVAAAFSIDQLTKAVAQSELADGRTIDLVPGLRLDLVYNPGVAFGLGGELGAPLVVGLMVVSVALLTWAVARAVRGGGLLGTLFLAAAAGGGAGNIWDRISRATDVPLSGEVVDFIALDSFAIFNVADIFTTCGIAGWAIVTLLSRDSGSRRTA